VRIVVVGGGIVGLSTAWAAVRAGHSVTLVEQGPLPNPRASSHGAHRLIRAPYGSMDGYAAMIPGAFSAWARLWADLGRSLYAETGTLALGSADSPGWTTASAAQMKRLGIPHRRLTRDDLDREYPWVNTAPGDWGFHLGGGGILFASRILEGIGAWLRTRARVDANRAARSVDADGGAVETDAGRIEADAVVVAAGPWAGRLIPDLATVVTPSRQVVTFLEPPPDLARIWATGPMLLDVGTAGFYAVPPRDGTPLKVGDHRFSLDGDPDRDRDPTPDELRAVAELARDRLRGFDGYRVAGGGTCFYTVEAKEEFVVERRGRAVIATGFSGHGFKFGAAVGERIVRHLDGQERASALSAWAAGKA